MDEEREEAVPGLRDQKGKAMSAEGRMDFDWLCIERGGRVVHWVDEEHPGVTACGEPTSGGLYRPPLDPIKCDECERVLAERSAR